MPLGLACPWVWHVQNRAQQVPNGELMLDYRLRRRTDIKSALGKNFWVSWAITMVTVTSNVL